MREKIASIFRRVASVIEPQRTVPLKLVVERNHPFECSRCGLGQELDQVRDLDRIHEMNLKCANPDCGKVYRFRPPLNDYELPVPSR